MSSLLWCINLLYNIHHDKFWICYELAEYAVSSLLWFSNLLRNVHNDKFWIYYAEYVVSNLLCPFSLLGIVHNENLWIYYEVGKCAFLSLLWFIKVLHNVHNDKFLICYELAEYWVSKFSLSIQLTPHCSQRKPLNMLWSG